MLTSSSSPVRLSTALFVLSIAFASSAAAQIVIRERVQVDAPSSERVSANDAFSTVLSVTPPDSVLRFGEQVHIGLTLTGPNGEFEPNCVRGRQWCQWKWDADLAEADWGDTGRLGMWAYWLGGHSSGTDASTVVDSDTVRTQWWHDLHYVTSNGFPFYEGYPLGNTGDRTEGLFGYIYDYREQTDELETPVQVDFSVTGVYRDWNPDPEPDTTNTVVASVEVLPPWLEAQIEAPFVSLGAEAPLRAETRDALGPVPLDPERPVWVYIYPIWVHPEDPEPINWYDGGGGQILNTRTGKSSDYGLRVPYKDVRDGNVVYQAPTTADFEYGQARRAEAGRLASEAGGGLERRLARVRDQMLDQGLDLDRVEAHVGAVRSRLEQRVIAADGAPRSARVEAAPSDPATTFAEVYFDFTGYDMYEWGTFELIGPTVRLLGVDDQPYPLDYVMVSRFPTDERFPKGDRFETNQYHEDPQRDLWLAEQTGNANAGDRFVVRASVPSATAFGANVDCSDVRFELRVQRDGAYQTFRSSDGQQSGPGHEYYEYDSEYDPDDRGGECRMNHFVRFVSNAEPGQGGSPGTANPHGGTYDDEFGGSRTVRVELNDIVEIIAVAEVDGVDVATNPMPIPVGDPDGGLATVDAPALVHVQWASRPAFNTAPDVMTARLSEDFAQVAVAFEDRGPMTTYDEVQNVFQLVPNNPTNLDLANWTTTAQGTIGLRFRLPGGSYVTAEYEHGAGEKMYTIARGIRESIRVAAGKDQTWFEQNTADFTSDGATPTSSDIQLVLIDRGNSVDFDPAGFKSSADVDVSEVEIFYSDLGGRVDQVLRMNARDADRETLDLIAARSGSLWSGPQWDTNRQSLLGAAIHYVDNDLSGVLTSTNTVLLDYRAADAPDDVPFPAAHEVGHVLLAGDEPGPRPSPDACRQWKDHSGRPTNFLECSSDPQGTEDWDESKRFLDVQAHQIRAQHGPTLSPIEIGTGHQFPRLLRPLSAPLQERRLADRLHSTSVR